MSDYTGKMSARRGRPQITRIQTTVAAVCCEWCRRPHLDRVLRGAHSGDWQSIGRRRCVCAQVPDSPLRSESKTIGKNSLTCITFDKPYFDWRGRFTASQGIWLKNVHVLRELNCGLDRACGRFHAPSRLEIPFFNYNDFFDFSVSVWFKREGGTGCWPVLVSNGDCAQRTIQV